MNAHPKYRLFVTAGWSVERRRRLTVEDFSLAYGIPDVAMPSRFAVVIISGKWSFPVGSVADDLGVVTDGDGSGTASALGFVGRYGPSVSIEKGRSRCPTTRTFQHVRGYRLSLPYCINRMDISFHHIGYAKGYNRTGSVLNRILREHGDSGTLVETVSLEDVLGVLNVADEPVVLSASVADELDCSRETIRRKLRALYERDDLECRKASRRVVYWEANVIVGAMGYDETARDAPQDAGDSIEGIRTSTALNATENIIDIDVILSDIEVPGFGEKAEARKMVVRAVLEYLVDHKEMESKTLKEVAWGADSEAYTNARGLWSDVVVEALHRIPEVSSADE